MYENFFFKVRLKNGECPSCMALLLPSPRRELIGRFVLRAIMFYVSLPGEEIQ